MNRALRRLERGAPIAPLAWLATLLIGPFVLVPGEYQGAVDHAGDKGVCHLRRGAIVIAETTVNAPIVARRRWLMCETEGDLPA